MNIIIRNEEEKDFDIVNHLTREAFWNVYRPGCDEHYLLHLLRKSPVFIKELDYVAEYNGEIVGNIVYSKAKIINEDNIYETIVFGPVSVAPKYQNRGIGSLLINHTLQKAKEMGFKSVIIFGNPDYYRRFGFENAQKYGITTRDGENFDPFMALELVQDGLKGVKGKFFEFEGIDYVNGLDDFDKAVPYKEKLVLPGQLS